MCTSLSLKVLLFIPLFLSLISSEAVESGWVCPCDDDQWCEPISGPPVRVTGEIYGFYGSWVHTDGLPPGQDMNWTHVTTVAWVDNDAVMCLAHQHGARAIIGAPTINLDELVNKTVRSDWIQAALHAVQSQFRDGIVFDYEDPLPEGSIQGQTYAALISETRDAFHVANPSLQITTCVPWSPDGIDGREYPFRNIADASDLIYVMDYDTRSQIFDACIAGANAPIPGMISGIERWFNLGVDPAKIILGVPWYGYRYPCLNGTRPDAIYCPIKAVPFRGVNCSDAAGIEVAYSDIQRVLRSTDPSVTGGLRRDSNTGSSFFNAVGDDSVVFQYWFDDPVSLEAKYDWARNRGLGGVGPFVFRNLDPVDASDDAVTMWTTFDVFVAGSSASSSSSDQRTTTTSSTPGTSGATEVKRKRRM
jgi:Di-N-acetylchitobiase